MQLLAKFKKILFMEFRATLNFRNFEKIFFTEFNGKSFFLHNKWENSVGLMQQGPRGLEPYLDHTGTMVHGTSNGLAVTMESKTRKEMS